MCQLIAIVSFLTSASAIAKLDRLARNLNFISNIMESGVEFAAADMPQANNLTVYIMVVMAEHERKMIRQRAKAALEAAKARGVKLGTPATLSPAAARQFRAKVLASDWPQIAQS